MANQIENDIAAGKAEVIKVESWVARNKWALALLIFAAGMIVGMML